MTYSIVVADDNHMICNGIVSLIKQECLRLEVQGVFYSGTDLYEFLQAHSVNIVVADIRMQGYDGLDIAEYIRNEKPDTYVLLITGHRVFDYAARAANLKLDAFITKPFLPDELVQKLETLCDLLDESHVNHNRKEYPPSEYIPFVLHYIEEHCYEEELSLAKISELLHLTPDYLGRLFKRYTGTSYSQYISKIRMERAAKLLTTTEKSVADIAAAIGYSRTNYFRRYFKAYFGYTPLDYRKMNIESR